MLLQNPPSQQRQEQLYQEAARLLSDNDTRTLVQKINNEYQYWDKVKYLCPQGINPETLWTAVRISRNMNTKTIPFGNMSVHFTLTDKMMQLLNLFDLHIGGTVGSKSLIPENDKNYYLISSIMEEAIASSQMEGASTTRKVAKDMLRTRQKPQNKSQQMIVNNYQTIQYLSLHCNEAFSMEQLQTVHHLITEHTLNKSEDEGRLRENDNIVVQDAITGDIAHIPPQVTDIKAMLEDLCRFANHDDTDHFIHPIVKAIIIHFMLAYIHPFVDGNGRTARSLFYWYMLQRGYNLMEYISISRVIYKSKKSYEKSFLQTEADGLDMSYFILYNLESMQQALEDLKSYLQRKTAEQDHSARYLRSGQINARQAKLLQQFADKPNKVILAKEIALQYGITAVTARTDLQGLVRMGLFVEVPLNGKTTAYMAAPDCRQRAEALADSTTQKPQ